MTTATAATVKKAGRSKTACRIVLDIVLILVLITLYSKNVISLMYHEVTGLVLFVLFALHLALNRKWIANLLGSRLGKGAKPRIMAAVNVLLVLSWLTVMVTGILVSKKIFAIQLSSLNPFHFFSSALALIVTGVHFGLHWHYFWGFLGKRIRLPRTVAVVLMVAVILFGCLQTVNSSFPKWISAPFTAGSGEHGAGGHPEKAELSADVSGINETESGGTFAGDSETGHGAEEIAGENPVTAEAGSRSSHGQQPFSVLNLLNIIATYFSIVFLFAALTRGTELAVKKVRTRKARI